MVENSDKNHVSINISAKEQNRLAIEGRRIANVVPSQKGILSTLKDESTGSLFFALTDAKSKGTSTLFITDDKGTTYKLILVPRAIAGEEIILKPPFDKSASSKGKEGERRTLSYQRRIKELMLTMTNEGSSGIEPEVVNKDMPLWKEGRLVCLTRFKDGDLVGEKYLLKNVSRSTMVITEQELYRRGVQAVAVENLTLGSGDSTYFYVVAENKDHE